MSDSDYTSFQREQDYPISLLRASERNLLKSRQADREISAKWRAPSGPDADLINLRNTELVPIKLFSDHKKLSDNDTFRLMPRGNPVDAQIRAADRTFSLQITLAHLDWEGGERANPGYQHRLEMEALNQRDIVIGHGPFLRTNNGLIQNEESVYSPEKRLGACRQGLARALRKKMVYDGRGCDLLIHACAFSIQTIDGEFEEVVRSTVTAIGRPPFDHVYVFDEPEGWFVEL